MKMTTSEDIKTGDQIMCVRITYEDMIRVDLSEKEKTALKFFDDEGSISSRILAVAIIAHKIEKAYRSKVPVKLC